MTAPVEPSPYLYTVNPPPLYTYQDYLDDVAVVIEALAALVARMAEPYRRIQLTRRDWLEFLAATYPYVEDAFEEIGEYARRFYDSERDRALDLPAVDVPVVDLDDIRGPDGKPLDIVDTTELRQQAYERVRISIPPYEPDWYEEAMEAQILPFTKPGTTENDVVKVIGVVQKAAEKGGRDTTLWAVQNDPRVRGWARVEGNENIGSCGFCAMLISRGPVYKDPLDAGLNVTSQSRAVEMFRQADVTGDASELMGQMVRWHPNCDCKVVPVFRGAERSWPGYEQFEEMQKLWADVQSDFRKEFGRPPGQGDVGRDGSSYTREALNAFRRRLERGDIPYNVRRPRAA